MRKLAILGGPSAFAEALHVGRPNMGDKTRLMQRIQAIVDGGWLTNRGPSVVEFERQVGELIGVKHCIAVCNATVGLEIAIRAAGLRGEVIVPSYTFIATAHALQWQEITPVFCDIDPASHNIDPKLVARIITPRTTGLIGVHVWGRPCDVDALQDIADHYELTLLFDAAHAFNCSHKGRMIGTFGKAEVFSFHATKVINTFEGGAIVTNDDQLAGRARLMQNFGFRGYDDVVELGTNGKMSEVAAAMGLNGLEAINGLVAKNHANYEAYLSCLGAVPGLSLIPYDHREKNNYHYVVAEIDEGESALSRDELIAVLHAENVLARKYFWPGCHNMMPYKRLFPDAGILLPATEALAGRVMVLPTGTDVGEADVATIGRIIGEALANAREVRLALKSSPLLSAPHSLISKFDARFPRFDPSRRIL